MAARKTKKKATKAKAKAKATKRSAKRSPNPARPRAKRGLHLMKLAPSLTVDDLAKSLAWYTETLGFKITQRWENEGRLLGAELAAGDVDIYLSQEDGGKGPRMKGQGFRLYWYTQQNVDQMADGIKARGGMLTSEPKDEWGVRSFSLVDPTGYLITISTER
jgi:uncharacterized glyoxalase superfamily protein PhnB